MAGETIPAEETSPWAKILASSVSTHHDRQALHRVRERLVRARTALTNEIRSLLYEYGIVLPKGTAQLRLRLHPVLEQEQTALSPVAQELFAKLCDEFGALEDRISSYDAHIKALAEAHPACQRLLTIPGIGPLSATAIVAAVSDARVFKNGRHFAAWLGLVPQQHSTGGQPRLLGISKRGNGYLRKLLIHGARTSLRWVKLKTDRRSAGARALMERRGVNKAVVAMANKWLIRNPYKILW